MGGGVVKGQVSSYLYIGSVPVWRLRDRRVVTYTLGLRQSAAVPQGGGRQDPNRLWGFHTLEHAGKPLHTQKLVIPDEQHK